VLLHDRLKNNVGIWVELYVTRAPLMIFLPLEAAIGAAVCEVTFFVGPSLLARLFEEGFLGCCLAKGRKL